MATRVISTKIAIEGESEYRASVSRINSEIKTLQSALKLTESQYQTNANSMAALAAKGEALSNLYKAQETKVKELRAALENAKTAEEKYASQKATLTAKIEANNRALEELKNTTGDTSEEQERLTAENKELADQLEKCEAGLSAAEKGVNSWQTQLNNAEIKLNNLDAELKQNDKYMDEAKNSADGCATSIDEFGDKIKKSAEKADTLRDALMAAGVVAALKATADALKECVEASIDFESAMAGVAKTTDLTEVELSEMGESIKALATKIPATAVEIANVTEVAGQLGIKKEELLAFSEVMINLGVATNLSSTEAASALAKFANVVGMSADDYERLGSTIVDLGNNFATTEADIVSMATRLASSGAIIGLSESEIMAVATALSSVGIEAEAGGSAISKLLKQFEVMVQTGSPALADFAAIAGMSADEFSKKWGENAVEALSLFIDGLRNVDASGGSSVKVLNDLGITEVRMSNAVLALASSNGILNTALEKANNAWDENSALAKEAATRYETTESKLQLLSNAYTNVKIAVGDQLTPALGRLADTGADVLNWAADMIEKHELLAPAITAAATALGVFAAGIITYTAVTKVAAAATKAFDIMLAATSGGVTLIASGIAALVAGIAIFAACVKDDAVPSVKELTAAARDCKSAFEETEAAYAKNNESIRGNADLARDYVSRLADLESQLDSSESAQYEYRMAVDSLNQLYPELNLSIDKNTGLVNKSTQEILNQIDAFEELALKQALQDRYTQQLKIYNDVQAELYANQARRNILEKQHTRIKQEQAEVEKELLSVSGQRSMELYTQYGNLNEQLRENEKEQKNLNKAISEGSETLEEYKQPVEDAIEALKLFEEEQAKGNDAQKIASGIISDLTAQIDDLAQGYNTAYAEAHKSISSQISLFDDFAAKIEKDTDSVDKMLKKWADQVKNLGDYTENLKKAAEYGIDNGLLQQLSDGSTESAGYIATIVNDLDRLNSGYEGLSENTSARIKEINDAFASTKSAQSGLALQIGSIKIDLASAVSELEEQTAAVDFSGFEEELNARLSEVGQSGFASIGENIGAGLVEGVQSGKDDAVTAAVDVTNTMTDAAKKSVGVNSPSTVYHEIGYNIMLGLSEGVTSGASGANDAILGSFSAITDSTHEKITALLSDIEKTTGKLPDHMTSVGAAMVDGMISGLNARSSALYRVVSRIVNKAISEARTAADVHSPSKKTQEIFENVGEGMIVGLERKRAEIVDTAQDVVNQALKLDVSGKVETAILGIDDRMPVDRSVTSRENANGTRQNIFINGTIRVEGVNNQGEFVSAADYSVEEVLAETLRRQIRR